jgi:hypothetical protein
VPGSEHAFHVLRGVVTLLRSESHMVSVLSKLSKVSPLITESPGCVRVIVTSKSRNK